MANRGPGYGLSAEVKGKISAKYDTKLATEAMDFILFHVPDAGVEGISDEKTVHEKLKDGVILCKLINALEPSSVKKINTNKMAFKQMENIGNFLTAAANYGVIASDLFQTVDLYERGNMPSVISSVHALGRKAQTKGKHGIGPKESDTNVRTFTEEQMKAGSNIIGLQMGSNKGATQAGQNFGKSRAIID